MVYETRLEHAFCPETAQPGSWNPLVPSAGHCAVAALVVQEVAGGELVSATVNGFSHWYNRIGREYVDVTGDQFGRRPVQVSDNELYEGTRVRGHSEVNDETWRRALKLMHFVHGHDAL